MMLSPLQGKATMDDRFKDQVVLVAGGTGGLGRAVSLAFLAAGARVYVTYQNPRGYEQLKAATGKHTSSLEGVAADVTGEAAVQGVIDVILKQSKRLDVLINAVGGYAGGTKLWEVDADVFDRMLSLNLRSGYALLKATIPVMLRQSHGSIVNVIAKAAVDHGGGAAAYAASKAGALALTDSAAADLRDSGIRLNSILPAIIDTEANRRAMPQADFNKWPKPEDIARVILFLASDEAKTIHGAAIPV